ncbi:MAG: hypothetical protein K9J06_12375 [Flavobacteriales bacterium]|nr:hypothetical protein [Flavobacteriales bacterium]
MRTLALPTVLLALLVAIGCQNPCTKTTSEVNAYSGDTIFTERTYPACGDSLTYHERQVKSDSTVIAQGEVVNGMKEGVWETNAWWKTVREYEHGIAIKVEQFHKNGQLMQEQVLGADSLYKVRSFYENGTLESEHFKTLDDYLTGHGIEYDTLGRKTAEGDHLAEMSMGDTVYVESPVPPYDLKMTVISEAGVKHGPWLQYDADGNVTRTVTYVHGIQQGEEAVSEGGTE